MHYDKVCEQVGGLQRRLRAKAGGEDRHRRTADITASAAVGLRYLLDFAADVGAVSQAEADALWDRGWRALLDVAEGQRQHHVDADPALRFVRLLTSAIASGGRAPRRRQRRRPASRSGEVGLALRCGHRSPACCPCGRQRPR